MRVYEYKDMEECTVITGRAHDIDDLYRWFTKLIPECEEEKHPMEIEREKRLAERRARQNERMLADANNGIYETIVPRDYKLSTSNDYGTISKEIIIVCGGVCLGTKGDQEHTNEVLSKINSLFELNGSYLVFVRSSQDDASLFNENRIEMSHIRTVEDYSVLKTKYYSVLCLGGSVSFDKNWKIKMGEFLKRKMYWENEGFNYNEALIDEVIKEHKIGLVVSDTCPTFTFPGMNSTLSRVINDPKGEVLASINSERKAMDNIYNKMISSDNRPYMWVYTKFDVYERNFINDIAFQSMSSGTLSSFGEFLDEFDLSYEDVQNGKTILFDDKESGRKKKRRKVQSSRLVAAEPIPLDAQRDRLFHFVDINNNAIEVGH